MSKEHCFARKGLNIFNNQITFLCTGVQEPAIRLFMWVCVYMYCWICCIVEPFCGYIAYM